ncbi:MAG: hypothetical protein P4L51_29385 [Puia sp.]|nr:hypothetical protein [Puia sp.]
MNGITASCIIADHAVRKNGKLVFEDRHADLPGFLLSVYQHFGLNYPRFFKMDNLSKLGWLAVEILLKDSFRKADHEAGQVGIVLMNAHSSLDTDLKYFESAKDIPSPSLFVYTLPNIMIGEICIRHQFKGEGVFFISEEFDAGHFVRYTGGLLDADVLQVCIGGWVDLLDSEYKAALFLIEKEVLPVEGGQSRPFDVLAKENIEKIFRGEKGRTKEE